MDIRVRTSLLVDGHSVTSRQIEVLRAIRDGGSKNAAAKALGISPPVVHRYMESMEEGIGRPMLKSTPAGTELTEDALSIIAAADAAELRNAPSKRFTIACTPVTQDLIMAVLSRTRIKAEVVVSDDLANIRMLREGSVGMIILDDPLHLFDLEDLMWTEVGHMDMVHVDNGPSYIRYRYGAQRIAYEYLDSIGAEYTVDAETHLLSDLLESGKSFFVDEFLLMRMGAEARSSTDKSLLRHTINAVYRRESPCVQRVLRAIRARHMID